MEHSMKTEVNNGMISKILDDGGPLLINRDEKIFFIKNKLFARRQRIRKAMAEVLMYEPPSPYLSLNIRSGFPNIQG